MDVKRFLSENLENFDPSGQNMMHMEIMRYALTGEEPHFSVRRVQPFSQMVWILTFDKEPDFWIAVFNTPEESVRFCKRYQLKITSFCGVLLH